jgi:hypothetical protein
MKIRRKQFGLSLTEVLTTLVIIVLLGAMSMPAINAFLNSMGSTGSCESMINASLSSARAIAMREQRYAGIRFQQESNTANPLKADQYMIFIIWEEPSKMGDLTIGFRAIEGIKPIKLPQNIGVTDLTTDNPIGVGNEIDSTEKLTDTTTFSIIFSPSGGLVIHEVQVRNRDGEVDSTKNILNLSTDDVFNKKAQVDDDAGVGMFYQDDYFGDSWSPYPNFGLGPEYSRRSFIIYEQDKFKNAYNQVPSKAYTSYLSQLKPVFLNSYSGQIISTGTK